MNRDSVNKEVLELCDKHNNMLIELPTGFGKSKLALDILKKHITDMQQEVLIVVPRLVLIDTWKKEFEKWGMKKYLLSVTFVTYVSLPKKAGKWSMAIFDECHHLSERCREALDSFTIGRSILLSATVKNSVKWDLKGTFQNLHSYKIHMKEAIDNEVLPDPRVFLIPLSLETKLATESIWKNPKGKEPVVELPWASRWAGIRQKTYKVRIYCTEWQYYTDLSDQIDFWKRKYMVTRNEAFKNKWLRLAGERLKWLSDKKVDIVSRILWLIRGHRTLTFCNSIEQTEELGSYCINSKNKNSTKILEAFNEGRIDHITACNMLNEGMNLVNCQVGIYNNLNSSEIIVKQRLGRILRHESPVIVIPYYKETREQELVEKMLEDYNPELITVLDRYEDLLFKI